MPNEINNLTKNKAYKISLYSFSNPAFTIGSESPASVIEFPAFVTDFSDSYKSEWNVQTVFGKMDPIATFKNTRRTINLTFDLPSESLENAKSNLAKIDYIIRGLYPVYNSPVLGTAVLSSPPLFRIRFSNLIRNTAGDDNAQNNTLRSGLLCYFSGFDFKPVNASGYIVEDENLYPKLITVNFSLNVIHEHPLGKYNTSGNVIKNRNGFQSFPRYSNENVPSPSDGANGGKTEGGGTPAGSGAGGTAGAAGKPTAGSSASAGNPKKSNDKKSNNKKTLAAAQQTTTPPPPQPTGELNYTPATQASNVSTQQQGQAANSSVLCDPNTSC